MQIGTRRFLRNWAAIESTKFQQPDNVKWIRRLPNGHSLTADALFAKGAWNEVLIFESTEGLDLHIPPEHFDIDALTEVLGIEHRVRCF